MKGIAKFNDAYIGYASKCIHAVIYKGKYSKKEKKISLYLMLQQNYQIAFIFIPLKITKNGWLNAISIIFFLTQSNYWFALFNADPSRRWKHFFTECKICVMSNNRNTEPGTKSYKLTGCIGVDMVTVALILALHTVTVAITFLPRCHATPRAALYILSTTLMACNISS